MGVPKREWIFKEITAKIFSNWRKTLDCTSKNLNKIQEVWTERDIHLHTYQTAKEKDKEDKERMLKATHHI